MHNIVIKSQASFAQYKSYIGLIELYVSDQTNVDLYTGHKHFVIERDELSIPSIEAIKQELNRNDELKYLAHEYNLIELHSQDKVGFLSYVSLYN
tara:strand:- start:2419 stop:2703 length:285 start_codon:yes stop_codon:yes gene_type:complete